MPRGNEKQYFEFEGNVTQLGATSEVANIGIKMLCPSGEELQIEEWLAAQDDISSAITVRLRKFNSNDVEIRRIGDASIDNDQIQSALSINETTTLGAGDVGSSPKDFLREGQYLQIFESGTLDATKKLFFRCVYSAYIQEAIFTAVGSGITLTITKHVLV